MKKKIWNIYRTRSSAIIVICKRVNSYFFYKANDFYAVFEWSTEFETDPIGVIGMRGPAYALRVLRILIGADGFLIGNMKEFTAKVTFLEMGVKTKTFWVTRVGVDISNKRNNMGELYIILNNNRSYQIFIFSWRKGVKSTFFFFIFTLLP